MPRVPWPQAMDGHRANQPPARRYSPVWKVRWRRDIRDSHGTRRRFLRRRLRVLRIRTSGLPACGARRARGGRIRLGLDRGRRRSCGGVPAESRRSDSFGGERADRGNVARRLLAREPPRPGRACGADPDSPRRPRGSGRRRRCGLAARALARPPAPGRRGALAGSFGLSYREDARGDQACESVGGTELVPCSRPRRRSCDGRRIAIRDRARRAGGAGGWGRALRPARFRPSRYRPSPGLGAVTP